MSRADRLLAILVMASVAGTATAAEPEQEAVLPRWNFKEERQLVYRMEMTMVSKDQRNRRETMARTLLINAGDGLGKVTIRVVRDADEPDADDPEAQEEREERVTIREDGRTEPGRRPPAMGVQWMLDVVFPLPERPLKPGERVSQPMRLRMMTGPTLRGDASFEHQGEEEIDGRTFLRYTVRTELSTPDGTPEVFSLRVTALAECLFDEERGRFQSTQTWIEFVSDDDRDAVEIRTELESEGAQEAGDAADPAEMPSPPAEGSRD